LAAHAASSAAVSATCTRWPDVLKVVAMTAKTSDDSTPGVPGIIFRRIQDSFTTQGLRPEHPAVGRRNLHLGVKRLPAETLPRQRR
jgi:hypothetical protein